MQWKAILIQYNSNPSTIVFPSACIRSRKCDVKSCLSYDLVACCLFSEIFPPLLLAVLVCLHRQGSNVNQRHHDIYTCTCTCSTFIHLDITVISNCLFHFIWSHCVIMQQKKTKNDLQHDLWISSSSSTSSNLQRVMQHYNDVIYLIECDLFH